MNSKYKEQLERLAETLCEPFRAPTQGELDFDASSYAEIADCIIERPEIAQLGKTAMNRWDDQGDYHRWDVV